MLLSLLLALTPTAAYPVLGSLGRPANAWFLEQVTRSDPQTAQALHEGSEAKPYTVSSLLDDRGCPYHAGEWLQPGQTCWLRVTSCEQHLSRLLLESVVKKLPERLTLYKMLFRLDGWTLDPHQHSWAGQTTYQDMAQQPSPSGRGNLARLEFASPTAFRSNGVDVPLPYPGSVFRSLWQKWNAFAPEAMRIQDAWPEFATDCLVVHELTAVNTRRWVFAEGTRGAATGFTGTVGFSLLPKRRAGQWAEIWDGADQVLQTMASFAFFAGVGHHTTIGMGQTRRVVNSYLPS